MTSNALRTLGVATRFLTLVEASNPTAIDEQAAEQHLTFLGLIGMMDPPRPEARHAVKQAKQASALRDMFSNHWLWGSILLSVGLQVILLNLPYLQRAFGVVSLSLTNWILCASVASSVLWVSEVAKYGRRRTAHSEPQIRTAEVSR